MYLIILLLWIVLILYLFLSEAPDVNIISCVVAAILQVAIHKRRNCLAESNDSPKEIEKGGDSVEGTVDKVLVGNMQVRKYKRSDDT